MRSLIGSAIRPVKRLSQGERPMNEKRKFPYNGKWITLTEVSKETGFTIDAINKHMARGKTVTDIIDKVTTENTLNIFD